MIPVGSRSLLIGVHQFVWHPLTVGWAWRSLYHRWPGWREWVCIFIHDIGYWGKREMDSEEGERHVELGARLAGRLFGTHYQDLCLMHSRHYALRFGLSPSPLCWADKMSIMSDPEWFYLARARLSGELSEYRRTAAEDGFVPMEASDHEWLTSLRAHFVRSTHAAGRDL